ncbi:MAG: hypothetical protein K6A23_11550 [Butyrivibrio sp.]|nr:hypothetical protein [Butyrivibrio sp.]
MNEFERKFGKYAISNLTLKLIICYIVGYILYYAPIGSGVLNYLTLNPYAILHGQVWRLVTWLIVPPQESNIFFALIMLFFYYSIGTQMERTWGDFKYTMYILSGVLLMIVGAFLFYGITYLSVGGFENVINVSSYFAQTSFYFGTYYICMSLLLAYAATYPDNVILFMFIIPLKMKWLGVIYGVWLAIEAIMAALSAQYYVFFPIAASLINFAIFWLSGGKLMRFRPKEVKRRRDFSQQVKMTAPGISRHKCAVCGRTELDDPNLEFRFCSKCNGNYEYCQDHLFTHRHVK